MIKELLIRPGTQDTSVYQEVIVENEYCLPPWFDPDDIILDVGWHIGLFALACLERGAGKIVCVEPQSENLKILHANVGDDPKVEIVGKALWNPDRETVQFRSKGDCTAMGHVADEGDETVGVVGLDQLIHNQGGLGHSPAQARLRAG